MTSELEEVACEIFRSYFVHPDASIVFVPIDDRPAREVPYFPRNGWFGIESIKIKSFFMVYNNSIYRVRAGYGPKSNTIILGIPHHDQNLRSHHHPN